MCEEYKDIINDEDIVNEEETTSELELTETEELYFAEPIIFEDTSFFEENEEFKKGVEDASWFAGFYATLISSGMSNKEAFTCMFTKMEVDLTKKVNETNANATIESAKFGQIAIEKTQV